MIEEIGPQVTARPPDSARSTSGRRPGGPAAGAAEGSGEPAPVVPLPVRTLATASAPIAVLAPVVADRDRGQAAGHRLHNIPLSLTSFIGRAHELAEARRLLGVTRLLTLTGPGGVGKTRLGYELADRLAGEFAGGVRLVELAPIADPTLVPQVVAAALALRDAPGRPLVEALIDALSSAPILLILDNCEHLIDACAPLADALLRACPDLRIVATSRQPLGIAGETTLQVPPLALAASSGAGGAPVSRIEAGRRLLPSEDRPPAAPGLAEASEAARLFVERAADVALSFALSDRSLAVIEAICRRLDGIPLAIELAAARVAVISPEQIAARLDDRFHLLTGGSRTALPRYRTLRAMIDWSHDLLDARERVLLRRLAVFAGTWTLEAAENVCAGTVLEPSEILDLLAGLVSKSLVRADASDGAVRYRLLETIHAYAAERLQQAGEQDALRARHLAWLVDLAERAEPELAGADQAAWLKQLDGEHDNVRTALAWSAAEGDPLAGARLATALVRFWMTRGCYAEGHRWFVELGSRMPWPPTTPTAARLQVRALRAASRFAAKHGAYDAAHEYLTRAAALAHDLSDRPGLAAITHSLGCLARVRGDLAAAGVLLWEARDRLRALDDALGVAETTICLGIVAHSEGDPAAARAHFDEGLAAYQQLGNRQGTAVALAHLGELALEGGDLDRADALLRQSLALADEIGDRERIAIALAGLAGVVAARGEAEHALVLAGAVLSLREALGKTAPPAWRARFDGWLAPARRLLGAEAPAALARGRTVPFDRAIADALARDRTADPAVAGPPNRPGTPSAALPPRAALTATVPPPVSPDTDGLTVREIEVAGLVARGLTNRQIAAALVISEGTAANHVKHILARLALDSRVQVAAWAIERGLHRRIAS